MKVGPHHASLDATGKERPASFLIRVRPSPEDSTSISASKECPYHDPCQLVAPLPTAWRFSSVSNSCFDAASVCSASWRQRSARERDSSLNSAVSDAFRQCAFARLVYFAFIRYHPAQSGELLITV